jgi:hypothetical protein
MAIPETVEIGFGVLFAGCCRRARHGSFLDEVWRYQV